MLNVYLYRDMTIGKICRAILFYVRVVVIMTLTSLFTRPVGNQVKISYLILNMQNFGEELCNFNALLILMPFFTFITLDGILNNLFRAATIVYQFPPI